MWDVHKGRSDNGLSFSAKLSSTLEFKEELQRLKWKLKDTTKRWKSKNWKGTVQYITKMKVKLETTAQNHKYDKNDPWGSGRQAWGKQIQPHMEHKKGIK